MGGARTLDLAVTHVLDPALDGERNLLHQAFGAGFAAIVAVNVAAVAGLTWLVARSVPLNPSMQPAAPGLGRSQFLSAFFFGAEAYPWWSIVYRRPGRTRSRWLLGRMAPWPAVAVSVVAAAGNLASHAWLEVAPLWTALVGTLPALLATLTSCIVLALAAWLLWEHARYRRRMRRLAG